jgi:hypothetical protein
MGWRDEYNVHPAADVFPMMDDDEPKALGEDIRAFGLRVPLLFWTRDGEHILLDGRNRLEAMERADITIPTDRFGLPDKFKGANASRTTGVKDPVSYIIGLNIRRRHLSKMEQAELIVKALKADKYITKDGEPVSRQPGGVAKIKGGGVIVASSSALALGGGR